MSAHQSPEQLHLRKGNNNYIVFKITIQICTSLENCLRIERRSVTVPVIIRQIAIENQSAKSEKLGV